MKAAGQWAAARLKINQGVDIWTWDSEWNREGRLKQPMGQSTRPACRLRVTNMMTMF